MRRSLRIAPLALLLLAAACTPDVRWLREDLHPVAVHGDRHLERARIWTCDTVVQWRDVLITQDSISGVPDRPEPCDNCRVALAARAIDSLQVGYSTIPNPRVELRGDTSKGAPLMMAAQGDLTVLPGGGSVNVGGHLSWKTPIRLGIDGAVATSVLGGTYDFADGDISIDAIPLFSGLTIAPRIGLSTVIVGDKKAFDGMNAGIAFRRRTAHGEFFRLDLIYRRVGGYVLSTIGVGTEFRLGK